MCILCTSEMLQSSLDTVLHIRSCNDHKLINRPNIDRIRRQQRPATLPVKSWWPTTTCRWPLTCDGSERSNKKPTAYRTRKKKRGLHLHLNCQIFGTLSVLYYSHDNACMVMVLRFHLSISIQNVTSKNVNYLI